MDFNTGGESGRGPSQGGPGGGMSGPDRTASGGSGSGDFNLGDPVQSFIRTTRGVLLNPVAFFRDLPRQGGFVPPLVFALICSVIAGVLGGIVNFLLALSLENSGVGGAVGALFSTLILTPIFTAIGLFIGAGIYHLLVFLLVRPSNAGFEATFRVVAYASVTQLLSWLAGVPILGILVGLVIGVYSIVLSILGVREMHSTTTGRSLLVVLIPVAVILLLALLLGVVVAVIIAAALNR